MQNGKTRRLTFNPATEKEEQLIRRGLAAYIPENAANLLLEGSHIVVGKGKRQEVYLISHSLWELYQQIIPHRHPYFLGLYLGELSESTLQPSLHVLFRLVDMVKDPETVIVNTEGEKRFLYGQPVENQHLKQLPAEPESGKKVLVINDQGEGLGYGRLKTTKKGEYTIKNQQDLGWYLRRGR